jgi:hypothetical protein
MGESLKSEFHKQEELGVVVVGPQERGMLPSLMNDSKTRVIVLQLFEGELDVNQVKPLLEWVRAGHSLWFYDARLGPHFGFAPVILKGNQFTNKPESGSLGDQKYDGAATTGVAFSGHPVITGVGQISAFLPKIGPDEYGAVNVTADTVGLIRFTNTSPAIAALRRDGRGLIVFKTLLWPEALSGDRFQSNLLEFSAGYQVPGMAGTAKLGNPPGPEALYVQGNPATKVVSTAPGNVTVSPTPSPSPTASPTAAVAGAPQDQVEVSGEGTLTGFVVNERLRFETGTARFELTRAEVESIELSTSGQLDVVHWRDGRVSKGLLMEKSLEFESAGDTRRLEKRLLRKIRWSTAGPTS